MIKIALSKTGKKYPDKFSLLSDEDEELTRLNWTYATVGYAQRRADPCIGYLHHVVFERLRGYPLIKGETIDHIDENKLNNQRHNLRIATQGEQILNTSLRRDNTSGVKGIYFRLDTKKWQVYIGVNKKRINLGCFEDLEEAKKVRQAHLIKIHGEFANDGTGSIKLKRGN